MPSQKHEQKQRYLVSKKVSFVGLMINTFLAAIKILFGLIGRSPALLADGIHSLADLVGDVLVLIAGRFANEKEDMNHPYGHQRIETLATVALSVLLIGTGVSIALHAIEHLWSGRTVFPDYFTVLAAFVSIGANEWLFHYTLKMGNKIDSDMLRANAWHSRGDAWSSIVVLFGLLAAFMGYPLADSVAAIVISLMIMKMGVQWFSQSIAELIDTGADAETLEKLEKTILASEGVKNFHNLRTRKMAGQLYVDVHLLVDYQCSASEGHHIGESAKADLFLCENNIKDITIHIDTDEHTEKIPVKQELLPGRTQIYRCMLHPCLAGTLLENKLIQFDLFYGYNTIEIRLFFNDDVRYVYTKQKIHQLCDQITQKHPELKAINAVFC
jgi:cation diffusion facilitator family transporter